MTCNCIETVDAMLRQHNTRLMIPIILSGDQTPRVMIVTDQIEKGRGKMNSALVEFLDGEKVITQRYAVRKLPA